MKKYTLFIGIDISKSWIDVSLTLDGQKASMPHHRFANREKSFVRMQKWIDTFSREHQLCSEQWLFCMEHTGVYTLPLTFFLQKHDYDYVVESALQIKRSIGLKTKSQ